MLGKIPALRDNLFIFAVATLLLGACRAPRHIYSPALPDQAFLEEKGDSKLAAYYAGGVTGSGSSRSVNGFDLQGAYAVTNHWAVLLGHSNRSERDFYSKATGYDDFYFLETDVRYKRRMTDIGLGYFGAVGRRSFVYMGINGGLGFGNMTMREQGQDLDTLNFSRSYKSNLNRLFFTPYVNINATDFFKIALSGRFSFVRFREEENDYTQPEIDYLQLGSLSNNTQAYFEPALQLQFIIRSAPFIRLEGGLQFCTDKSYALQSRSITGFVGVNFDLSKLNN